MEPRKDGDAVVDLVDVLLEDGAVLAADAVITVADVPLVGLQLRMVLAGMTEMTERGILDEWDRKQRRAAVERADADTAGDGADVDGDPEGGSTASGG